MAKFDFKALLNEQSKSANTATTEAGPRVGETVLISIDKLRPSKNNFYDTSDVKSLAASIEAYGMDNDLIVSPAAEDGTHEVISGHRRLKACQLLLAEGKERYQRIACKIKETENADIAQLQLIFANSTQRELTPAEKVEQINQTQAILKRLKAQGYKFTGRLRDMVADMLNTSPTQVARAEAIEKNLTQPLKEKMQSGELSVSAAYELSKAPEEQQAKANEEIAAAGKMEVKQAREQAASPQNKQEPNTKEIYLVACALCEKDLQQASEEDLQGRQLIFTALLEYGQRRKIEGGSENE